jgi:eukaryotic-like serine/threonine-protein kinase
VCVPAVCNDASMFRGNAAHSGIYDAIGAPQTPKLKWKFQTRSSVISSPAVVGGVLYVGSNDHNLYAASPAVAGGIVYFGSYDGYFYAVDVAGKQKWKFQTDGERRHAPPWRRSGGGNHA